ncbi:MAG: right-handed parallel beta-helix repeat-containing protein, partial [Ornithinimicrobium sp.]
MRRRATPTAIIAATVAALVLTAAPTSTAQLVPTSTGTILHVAPSGCSDSGQGTLALPFCTVVKAAKVATAGTTVLVADGTYPGEVRPWRSGTPAAPIVYAPEPGARPVLTGGKHNFTISKLSNLQIRGFTLQDATADAIVFYSASDILMDDNVIQRAGAPVSGQSGRGIYLSDTFDSTFSGNTIRDNAGSGVYISGGSSRNTFSGNDVSANAYGYIRNGVGIDVRASGNTIIGNRTHDNEDSGIQVYPGGDNTVVVNNISYDNAGFTTTMLSNCSPPPSGAPGCITGDHGIDHLNVTGGTVVGNTVYANISAGINIEGGNPAVPANFTVANNVVVDNAIACPDGLGGTGACPRSKGNIRVEAGSQLGTTLDYDLFHLSSSGYQVIWGPGWYTQVSAFAAATGMESQGLQQDPQFTNAAAGIFTPKSTSPAIDSAKSDAPSQTTSDAVGTPRTDILTVPNTGSGPRGYDDRGALEVGIASAAGESGAWGARAIPAPRRQSVHPPTAA